MRPRLLAAVWLLVCLSLAAGCKLPMEPRFEKISEFKPHLKSEARPAGFTLGLDLYNPNRYKLKVLAYDLQIFLNERSVGSAQRKEKQVLAGNGTTTFRMEVATDLQQVLGGLISVLSDLLGKPKPMKLRVKGTVTAAAKGIRKLVPIDFERAVEMNG